MVRQFKQAYFHIPIKILHFLTPARFEKSLMDDTHMTSFKTLTFKTPTALVHLRSKCFHLLDLGRQIFLKKTPYSTKYGKTTAPYI